MKFEWPSALKLPSGFVGKMSATAIFYLIFCTVAVVALPDGLKVWPLVIAPPGYLAHLLLLLDYSRRNPILTALEGSTAVAYLRADMAAKDPKVIEGSSVPVENPRNRSITAHNDE